MQSVRFNPPPRFSNKLEIKKPAPQPKILKEEQLASPLEGKDKEENWDPLKVIDACLEIADGSEHGKAQATVGLMRLKLGEDKVALKYFQKAANNGNQHGQNNLGYMYENGLGGLDKNINEAKAWYKKAAANDGFDGQQGLEVAKSNLERLNNDRGVNISKDKVADLMMIYGGHHTRQNVESKVSLINAARNKHVVSSENENQKPSNVNIRTFKDSSVRHGVVAK